MFQTEIKNDKVYSLLIEAAKGAELIATSRHASALVYKKQVLAVGVNSRKTHPLASKFNGKDKPCTHSELDAVLQVLNQYGEDVLKRCSIYNLRLTSVDRVAGSKPCVGCSKMLDAFGVRKRYWT